MRGITECEFIQRSREIELWNNLHLGNHIYSFERSVSRPHLNRHLSFYSLYFHLSPFFLSPSKVYTNTHPSFTIPAYIVIRTILVTITWFLVPVMIPPFRCAKE